MQPKSGSEVTKCTVHFVVTQIPGLLIPELLMMVLQSGEEGSALSARSDSRL